MSHDAYRSIAQSLVASLTAQAPGPFERIEAQFRVHDRMFSMQCVAVRSDGKTVGFPLRDADADRIRQAVRGLRQTLPHGAGPAFVRADFHFERSGKFRFDVYYPEQLLERLAQLLRRSWPPGVARLRLAARHEPRDEGGSWQLAYYDVSAGRARALPRPRSTLDFDDPLWLLSDLVESLPGRPWKTFEMELEREGPYTVRVDGEPLAPR